MDQQIHFEVFARRPGASGYVLDSATEDRVRALETAEELLSSGRAVAVKVTKEMLDPASGEFKSLSILNKGVPEKAKAAAPVEDSGPLCVAPPDLYTAHAREKIGRLLENWLARQKATPFELMHRPDLVERLEASGVELQHAIQKVAVPDAQARGVSVHEVMRHFQGLSERAIERVLKDGRKKTFADLQSQDFAALCVKLAGDPERHYLVGGAVAAYLAGAPGWSGKVDRLLDLADRAPEAAEHPQARALAFQVLEQPLGEILGSRLGLADLLGPDLDLGAELAALTRLAAAEAAEAMIRVDSGIFRLIPVLDGPAARLAKWLDGPHFEGVRGALAARVLRELTSKRRLRPCDARGEIDILRALAMALTAAAGRLIPLDDVRAAFVERSGMLVSGDFVDLLLRGRDSAMDEVRDLVWLMENVIGAANKRAAARWLIANLSGLRFETELKSAAEPAAQRLAALADLQRLVRRAAGDISEGVKIVERIGDIGGAVEADAKLTATFARAPVPLTQKLSVLVKMASTESAPAGPAADRARTEVVKLLRAPESREALAAAPDLLEKAAGVLKAQAA